MYTNSTPKPFFTSTKLVLAVASLFTLLSCGSGSGEQQIDSNTGPVDTLPDCTLTIDPGTVFDDAFGQLEPGETLCLSGGKYIQAMQIPSDINVRAVNDGMAELDGQSVLGLAWQGGLLTMRGNNSSVRGLRVHHAGTNSDACSIRGTNNTMRLTSCSHGGSYKHKVPLGVAGSGHLIEDSWFYGEGRYVLQCYLGSNITIRRNVIRWDETVAGEPNEPNAAMSNYSCSDMIWENNVSIDYGLPVTPMVHCGDICMSTTFDAPNFRVQYLGNIVVNHATGTSNNIAFRADQKSAGDSSDITVSDFYVKQVATGIVFNPKYKNTIIGNCTMQDVNSAGVVDGDGISCNNNADIAFRYINATKTSQPLFPFAHQALIKRDFCATTERQSDWCNTSLTLSEYILD